VPLFTSGGLGLVILVLVFGLVYIIGKGASSGRVTDRVTAAVSRPS